jgi:hypothetical protein
MSCVQVYEGDGVYPGSWLDTCVHWRYQVMEEEETSRWSSMVDEATIIAWLTTDDPSASLTPLCLVGRDVADRILAKARCAAKRSHRGTGKKMYATHRMPVGRDIHVWATPCR